ncbi:MAG TPA: DUF2306 domain-containing protein [Nocardioides sp.]|nr:DUF2306 domain-containing protein [Nocardioides sp.]
MQVSRWRRAATVGWVAIAALAVVYGPMAVEYTWRFFDPGAPRLWDRTFAAVVDHDEVYGAGSIHTVSGDEYADNRLTMLFHTTTGGIAIVLFAAQFSARLRRNLVRHRVVGRVAAGLALVGMAGAAAYLVAVGPDDTFDGPAFHVQLWALAFGTATGTVLGVAAARRRQIAMHQALMAYAFALLLTAPLLRVGYLVLGNAWPDATQLETNLAGAAFLGTWAPFGAFLAARAQDRRRRRSSGIPALPGRRLDVGVLLLAAAAAPVLVARHGATIDGPDRVTVTGLVGALVALAVAVANLVGARRAGAEVAAEEWRVACLGLVATAPTAVVTGALLDLPFSDADAWFATLLTAPAIALSLGFLLVVWRRRTIRNPRAQGAALEPVPAPSASVLPD